MLRPPGSGTPADQLRALHKRIEELSRTRPAPPTCVVRLTADANLPAGKDTFAQLGWAASYDPLGMFTAGAAGVPASIHITRPGYYRVHYHCAVTGPSAVAGAKVSLSSASITNSIATDARPINQQGSDGAVLDAVRSRVYLDTGRIYWSNWCSNAATLRAVIHGVPTEITVQYDSAQ
ncbi:hypothetical protein SAMN05421810_10168 [Amycolatopsis arida]|uniref:Uncharacterized protein n=1 Tax=Amycolatopsis arida TaxID=587909 RepID=A0A1I5KAT1_9PSEU|nr:hypothetical protein [Amycolatopsis arida]TDX96964.1 hypothetical protein CLV69_10266 [Amycolatopsis arida]SFO82117.1 hypothetical protein SAMN05421810_10168 [Amycolatopsis arida]